MFCFLILKFWKSLNKMLISSIFNRWIVDCKLQSRIVHKITTNFFFELNFENRSFWKQSIIDDSSIDDWWIILRFLFLWKFSFENSFSLKNEKKKFESCCFWYFRTFRIKSMIVFETIMNKFSSIAHWYILTIKFRSRNSKLILMTFDNIFVTFSWFWTYCFKLNVFLKNV